MNIGLFSKAKLEVYLTVIFFTQILHNAVKEFLWISD